jgi:DNA-binding FrmR family transcriptional regulator
MKTISQRLNNISGQIEGVKKMTQTNCDCEKVLTQLKAIKSGISSVIDEIVEAQFGDDKKILIKLKKYVKSN